MQNRTQQGMELPDPLPHRKSGTPQNTTKYRPDTMRVLAMRYKYLDSGAAPRRRVGVSGARPAGNDPLSRVVAGQEPLHRPQGRFRRVFPWALAPVRRAVALHASTAAPGTSHPT